MNYGLYISASGALTGMARQDVLAGNLANVSTTAFKPDRVFSVQRDAARIEDQLGYMPSNRLLERLGAGVTTSRTFTDFGAGPLETTGRPLDVAIEGEGFFVARAREGAGDAALRLTRDGRLTINGAGQLVRTVDGLPLLDAQSRPARVDPSLPVSIRPDGAVEQAGAVVTRLRVASPPSTDALRKAGNGLYAFAGRDTRLTPASGQVRQGALERSGVDPLTTIMAITRAGSSVEANARMIQIHNETMGRAISSLGRVS